MKVVGSIPTSPTCKRCVGSWFPSVSPELFRRSFVCVEAVEFPRSKAVGESFPARTSSKTSFDGIAQSMTTVLLVGCGAVGARAARQLAATTGVDSVVVDGPTSKYLAGVVASVESVHDLAGEAWESVSPDVVVLAQPAGHLSDAARALTIGAHVVSVSDDVDDVEGLLSLGPAAAAADRRIVLGAGFAPGLTCLLAVHAARAFDVVDEVHVAKTGTAGPACARQHHAALSADSRDWRDGGWEPFVGGSGRELCWFPDPIGGVDCYRAALVDPMLLQPVFPDAARITSRVGATRRDRATARLPMMRRPHPEAGDGAVRVEVRGRRHGSVDSVVLGCKERPSVASAAMLAVLVEELLAGRCVGPRVAGVGSQIAHSAPVLRALALRGIRCARFDGAAVGGR